MVTKTEKLDQMRKQIIESAAQRFQRFGYGKTNVAEIALDCGMSPGNLYRYFKNKSEIAEEIMRMSIDSTLAELRSVLRMEGLSARRRLEEFLLQELYFTYNQLATYPTLLEQIRDPRSAGPMLASEYLDASRALLVEILAMGNASGDFAIDDVVDMAETIQAATLKFRYPQLHTDDTLEHLEHAARRVIELILSAVHAPARMETSASV
jgi:AcrR family transcriptional regulator